MSMSMFNCVRKVKGFTDSIGESPQNPDGTIKGEETDAVVEKVKPTIVDTIALTGVIGSIVTMVFTVGHVVDIASVSTMGVGPLVVFQKRKLAGLGGLRYQMNETRHQVNNLTQENNVLEGNVDNLETQVTALENVEGELEKIAAQGQTNVSRLTSIVQENKKLQTKIKANLEQQIMVDVMNIVLKADRSGDGNLSKQEMYMLKLRMKNMPGFDFDEENFNKCLENADNVTTADVMNVFRNLKDSTLDEKDNIFHMHPEQLLEQD